MTNIMNNVTATATSITQAQALNELLYPDQLPDPQHEITLYSITHPRYDPIPNIAFHRGVLLEDRARTAPCDYGDCEIFMNRVQQFVRLDAEDVGDRFRFRNSVLQYWDRLWVAHCDFNGVDTYRLVFAQDDSDINIFVLIRVFKNSADHDTLYHRFLAIDRFLFLRYTVRMLTGGGHQ